MARAIAMAQRHLCGAPSGPTDTTCMVQTVERASNQYFVVLERRPPAGNRDRVVVRLRGDAENMDLEARQVAPTIPATKDLRREGVLMESMVDERPEMLSGPQLEYPSLLRTAGIQGRVLVRAIIDSTGQAEPASVQVIQSPHVGFDQAARNFVVAARFRPGRVRGRAVRVLAEVPITFRIAPTP